MTDQHQKMTKHTAGKPGGKMGPDEVLNIRIAWRSWLRIWISWAPALENLVEYICGLGRVLSGDVDTAHLAPVHGTALGNQWPIYR